MVTATAEATKNSGVPAAANRLRRASAAAIASASSALTPASSATLTTGPAASRKRPATNEAAAIISCIACG